MDAPMHLGDRPMANEFWVLVGLGPNNVEIPALIFGSKEAANKFCERFIDIRIREDDTTWYPIDFLVGSKDYNEETDEDDSRKFYTHYYDGCGACYGFELRKVEEGKPFVQWDLD
jgi:hypothetical protein